MQTLDLRLLTEMLGKIKDGERFGLGVDIFASLFPPGQSDVASMARAQVFAAERRCDLDYWRATNEVFFTKRVRPLPGRRDGRPPRNRANASHLRMQP
jgi:hypothetical protein